MLLAAIRDRKKRLTGSLIFLVLMQFCWQIINVLAYSANTFAYAQLLYDLDLPFVALVSLSVFLFIIKFYNLEIYQWRFVILLLCVIPVLTGLFALTTEHHELMRTNFEIVQTFPMLMVEAGFGPWFWIHAGYCYVLIMISSVIAIVQLFKIPKIYRRSSYFLLFGMLSSVVANVFVIARIVPVLDITLVGASVCTFFLYFSSRNTQGLDLIHAARENVLDQMDEAVLIIGDDNSIITKNDMAVRLLSMLEANPDITYPAVLNMIMKTADRFEQVERGNGGIDFHFVFKGGEQKIYNLQEKAIRDKRGTRMSTVVICTDVTENRETLWELERTAGLDALTGLLTRPMLDKEKKLLDSPENLPLAVIMGDLNHLKVVNDTYGHQQGDAMLRLAAETLITSCPPSARAARIGGDEFLVLIPDCDGYRAGQIIADIQYNLRQIQGYPFEVSISLGAAIKLAPEQNLNDLIEQADAEMYFVKKVQHAER
ncbi:MAG: histidine kinase N-terminal 7TM domain-containing protein [Christensenellaceae bacterium]|jgi:diguanylate cyclase (GGDEF)-like protein